MNNLNAICLTYVLLEYPLLLWENSLRWHYDSIFCLGGREREWRKNTSKERFYLWALRASRRFDFIEIRYWPTMRAPDGCDRKYWIARAIYDKYLVGSGKCKGVGEGMAFLSLKGACSMRYHHSVKIEKLSRGELPISSRPSLGTNQILHRRNQSKCA